VLSLVVASTSVAAFGCEGCPDLAYRAFEFELTNVDPGEVLYTVTDEVTGTVVCDATASAESCIIDNGVYSMVFEQGGVDFETLTGVCTQGDVTGCEAEDAEAKGLPPLIRVVHDANGWSATLERQGPCS
jgi:hypothetical protein